MHSNYNKRHKVSYLDRTLTQLNIGCPENYGQVNVINVAVGVIVVVRVVAEVVAVLVVVAVVAKSWIEHY